MMGLETRIADIARRILGEPNRQQSNRQTLRFGSNGSVAVDIAGPGAGQWFDHENGIGGGPWELIRVKARIADEDIPAWLEREIGIEREPRRGASNIAASYDYHDATGKLLFQVCRLKPKSFRQRRPDGNGGWQWSVKGVAMVPYRLPELAAARATGNGKPWRVYLCEGEKDCDRLRQQWRLIATTNPGGAGKWRAEYNQHFSGAEVIVLPDNDDAGRKHADQVAKALARIAVIVRIVELGGLPDKGDVSDWIDGGGSQSDLETLVELTEPYKPTAKGGPGGNPLTVSFRSGKESAMEAIEWLWPGWLARGKFHMLAGLKAAGKSTILFDLMARLTIGGEWPDRKPAPLGSVVIWSGEDGIEDTILPRFAAAGGDLGRIYPIKHVIANGEQRLFDPSTDMPVLIETISQLSDLLLLVLDPVVMALPTSLDSHKNAETRHGLQPLVGFAEDRGIALVGVTHFTKGTSDREPIERVTGSLAFGAVPRIVWGASADDDGSKRRLVRIASNIGPSGGGIEFSLYQAPLIGHDFAAQRVQWGTLLRGGARELLNPEKQSKLAEAVDFLQTFLADGPQTQKDVKEAAGAYGHTWATIRTAQEKLAIKPHKPSKVWVWELPAKPVLFNLSDG